MDSRIEARGWLHWTFFGRAPECDFNLLAVDSDALGSGPPTQQAFAVLSAMLDGKTPRSDEIFGPGDVLILWRSGGFDFLVSTGGWARRPAGQAVTDMASRGAHLRVGWAASVTPAAEPLLPAHLDRHEYRLREAGPWRNAPLLCQLMGSVFDAGDYLHPNILSLAQSISRAGYCYGETEENDEAGHQGLVTLHCLTNALSNDFMSFLNGLYLPAYQLPAVGGVLGPLSVEELDRAAEGIRRDGYHVFDRVLPVEACARLAAYAENSDCRLQGDEIQGVQEAKIDRLSPKAEVYRVKENLTPRDVQDLVSDLSILAVTQAYLRCRPTLSYVGMTWTPKWKERASAEGAQMFHFDMDRVKWLKWFIYVGDVTSQNGPHTVVRGSHRRGGKPPELLRRGYSRISDEDINTHYPRSDIVEISGSSGTIIAEDTRAFHRGQVVRTGERLMLQIEFSSSMVGTAYRRGVKLPDPAIDSLSERVSAFPRVYWTYA